MTPILTDYKKLVEGRKVVAEFPERTDFGVVKAAANELLSESEFGKVYKIGPMRKDKPLNGLRKCVINLAQKQNVLVQCNTRTLENGSYLFFKKEEGASPPQK